MMRQLLLAAALCAAATFATGQAKVVRIGTIDYGSQAERASLWKAFEGGLREAGRSDGAQLVIERRWADGSSEKTARLARELADQKVDVIVAGGTVAAKAALEATRSIPIVFLMAADPVKTGIVQSHSRPGGNATGFSSLSSELSAKRLDLLRQALPRLRRVAILFDPTNVAGQATVAEMQSAARATGMEVGAFGISDVRDLDAELAAVRAQRYEALLVTSSARFFSERRQLAAMILKHKLPATFATSEYVEAGGLFAYGVDLPAQYRQAGAYVDKILKGARPSDLPVERASKFELAINVKTAQALGLTLPPALRNRADLIIE